MEKLEQIIPRVDIGLAEAQVKLDPHEISADKPRFGLNSIREDVLKEHLAELEGLRNQKVSLAWHREPTFQAQLDRVTHSQAVGGNSVKLLVNGVASQAQREKNIKEADVIFLKTYNFHGDDVTGRRMIKLLKERLEADPKVKVFIQYDAKADTSNALGAIWRGLTKSFKLPAAFGELEKMPGCVLIPTNSDSPNLLYGKDHEKYLFTYKEGEPVKLIMGGMNVGDDWAYGGDPNQRVEDLHGAYGYRDTDSEICGPVVKTILNEYVFDAANALTEQNRLRGGVFTNREMQQLEAVLAKLQKSKAAYAPAGKATIRFVANRPEQGVAGQYIEALYLAYLERIPQGETATIVSPFFLPPDSILTAIKLATQRGVKVRLLLNPPEATESAMGMVATAAQDVYRELFRDCAKNKLEIYEYHGNPKQGVGSFHHKLAMLGLGGLYSLGSSNMDYHSLRHNTEGVVIVEDKDSSVDFAKMMQIDLDEAVVHRVTREEVEAASFFQRAKQKLLRKLRYIL